MDLNKLGNEPIRLPAWILGAIVVLINILLAVTDVFSNGTATAGAIFGAILPIVLAELQRSQVNSPETQRRHILEGIAFGKDEAYNELPPPPIAGTTYEP